MRIGRTTRRRAALFIVIGAIVIVSLVLLLNLESPRGQTYKAKESPVDPAVVPSVEPAGESRKAAQSATVPPEMGGTPPEPLAEPAQPLPVPPPPTATPLADLSAPLGDSDMEYLMSLRLLVPVSGIAADKLRDSYYDGRSEGRMHQALDIMAPHDTPVVATVDGTVAKLFQSDKGGITLYQIDRSGNYYYYYAHLSRYADGMTEGRPLKRGEVIGYVGDTGNAGAGNYHLHFGISKPTTPGKWSGGIPINPFPFLTKK